MSPEELAWAAGFFDGEGHTHLHVYTHVIQATGIERRYMTFQLMIEQAHDAYVLHRFQRAVGVGRVRPSYRPQDRRYQASSHEDVQAVIAMLWKWLSPVKRAQAAKVLREGQAVWLERRLTCPKGHPMDDAYHRVKNGRPYRRCRTCRLETERAWKARRRAA